MKIVYEIIDDSVPHYERRKFEVRASHVPRIGDRVVRHVDGESSLLNRFRVLDVTWVIETREWYKKIENAELVCDAYVTLRVEEDAR